MQSPDWGGEDGGETYIAFRMICPIDDLRRGSWGRRRLRQVGRDVGRRSFCHRGELLRATRYRILDLESRGQRSYSTPGLSRTDVPRGQFRINSIYPFHCQNPPKRRLKSALLDQLQRIRRRHSSMSASARLSPSSPSALQSSLRTLTQNYASTNPSRVKLIDSFLLFLLLSGVMQLAYRILITSYPYNAFLGGWAPLLSFDTDTSDGVPLIGSARRLDNSSSLLGYGHR